MPPMCLYITSHPCMIIAHCAGEVAEDRVAAGPRPRQIHVQAHIRAGESGQLTYAGLQQWHPSCCHSHLHRGRPICCACALSHQQPRQLQLLLLLLPVGYLLETSSRMVRLF
jgi:hypothetical protein